MLAYMVILQTWVIYVWIWPNAIAIALEGVYKPVAEILLMVCLGQTLENQVHKKREELKETLLAQTTALFRRPKMFVVALESDWSLTAGSLFIVNLYSIPGITMLRLVIGTLTTYTIFMVHLQLDEDGRKSDKCSASAGEAT